MVAMVPAAGGGTGLVVGGGGQAAHAAHFALIPYQYNAGSIKAGGVLAVGLSSTRAPPPVTLSLSIGYNPLQATRWCQANRISPAD